VLTLGRRDDVVDERPGEIVERATEQLGGRTVGGKHAAVEARHDHRVRERPPRSPRPPAMNRTPGASGLPGAGAEDRALASAKRAGPYS